MNWLILWSNHPIISQNASIIHKMGSVKELVYNFNLDTIRIDHFHHDARLQKFRGFQNRYCFYFSLIFFIDLRSYRVRDMGLLKRSPVMSRNLYNNSVSNNCVYATFQICKYKYCWVPVIVILCSLFFEDHFTSFPIRKRFVLREVLRIVENGLLRFSFHGY